MPDAGIRTDQEAAVVEAARDENRQGDERCTVSAGNDVGGGSHLAHVEFDLTDHSTVRRDLRNDLNEVRSNAFEVPLAVQKGRCVRIARNCDVQCDVVGQGSSLVVNAERLPPLSNLKLFLSQTD